MAEVKVASWPAAHKGGVGVPPTIFISYSRHDESAVKLLAQGLQAAHKDTWLDQALGGGDSWWNSILAKIRDAAVFIFAVSDDSLRSKPCRSELTYAKELGIPVLPVQVGEVESYRTDALFELQLIDYRTPSASAAFSLVAAVETALKKPRASVSPSPPPPSMPYEYMLRLASAVDAGYLSPDDQRNIVTQLRQAFEEEDDTLVHGDIARILRTLHSKPFVTLSCAREIESVLRDMNVEAPSEFSRPNITDRARQAQFSNQRSSRASGRRHPNETQPSSAKGHDSRLNGRPSALKKAASLWIVAAVIDLINTILSISLIGDIAPISGTDVAFAFLYITADILMMVFAGRMLANQGWARTALVITSLIMAIFDLVSLRVSAQLIGLGYAGTATIGILLTIIHLVLLLTATLFAYRPSSSSLLNSSTSDT